MKLLSPEHIRFGQRLRDLRKFKGLTQEMLAVKVKVDRSYIGAIEQGRGNASFTLIVKMAKALGVEPAELLKK
jgi:transcriptional regulator with XRE-family HTH domain